MNKRRGIKPFKKRRGIKKMYRKRCDDIIGFALVIGLSLIHQSVGPL